MCKVATRDNLNIAQLSQLFEPIVIALTLDDFKVKCKADAFAAYTGVKFEDKEY